MIERAGHWKHEWIPLDPVAASEKFHGHVPAGWSPPGGHGSFDHEAADKLMHDVSKRNPGWSFHMNNPKNDREGHHWQYYDPSRGNHYTKVHVTPSGYQWEAHDHRTGKTIASGTTTSVREAYHSAVQGKHVEFAARAKTWAAQWARSWEGHQ